MHHLIYDWYPPTHRWSSVLGRQPRTSNLRTSTHPNIRAPPNIQTSKLRASNLLTTKHPNIRASKHPSSSKHPNIHAPRLGPLIPEPQSFKVLGSSEGHPPGLFAWLRAVRPGASEPIRIRRLEPPRTAICTHSSLQASRRSRPGAVGPLEGHPLTRSGWLEAWRPPSSKPRRTRQFILHFRPAPAPSPLRP